MHIGFVTGESPYSDAPGGGIAAYLRAVIPAYLDGGHRVSLFAGADQQETFRAENNRVEVHHFRLPAAHWYASKVPLLRGTITLPLRQVEWSAAFYKRVARVAARENFDVLECTEVGGLFLGSLAPLVIRLHGSEAVFRKYTSQPPNLSSSLNDWLERRTCEKAAALTVPSVFQACEIASRRGWATERLQVVSNPISSELLTASAQASRPSGTNEPVVLYVGRLAPVKGIESLLATAARVHTVRPKATFILAGPWQMPYAPEKFGLKLNERSANGVLWVGSEQPRELVSRYQAATIFVMPSQFESFCISVVEAMAFRLPVIATRAGGLPELVQDGVTGEIVAPADAIAMANAIVRLLDDPKKREAMGQAARSRVFSKFTPENTCKAMLKIYANAANEKETVAPVESTATSIGARA
ncbi:MAG TPA: glycosyltransferase family 4 protein [Pyrinomonadaceae bacterium]